MMAQGDINEISHLLGVLSGKLDSLGEQVRDSEKSARTRWAKVYERMDDQDRLLAETRYSLDTVGRKVETVARTIDEDLKPVTDEVRKWKQQGMGALAIIGIGGSAFGAGVLSLLSWLGLVKWPS